MHCRIPLLVIMAVCAAALTGCVADVDGYAGTLPALSAKRTSASFGEASTEAPASPPLDAASQPATSPAPSLLLCAQKKSSPLPRANGGYRGAAGGVSEAERARRARELRETLSKAAADKFRKDAAEYEEWRSQQEGY